jgi:hypothetical protein
MLGGGSWHGGDFTRTLRPELAINRRCPCGLSSFRVVFVAEAAHSSPGFSAISFVNSRTHTRAHTPFVTHKGRMEERKCSLWSFDGLYLIRRVYFVNCSLYF